MPYQVIDVTPHPQSFAFATNRPIRGACVHNTVTAAVAATRQFAGWHWQIGRDGTRYLTVSEENVAFHVESTDRWRPPWVVPGPGGFSDANWCLLGVEFVSLAGGAGPPGYEAYTSDQYASGRELFAEWRQRYGDFPYVGHGELQGNRSDPVGFDWTRAGLGPFVPNWGRHFTAEEAEDVAQIAELEAKVAELVSTNSALADQVNALREEVGARTTDVARLSEALAAAGGAGRPRFVEVTTEDGVVHPFVREEAA